VIMQAWIIDSAAMLGKDKDVIKCV
jgi:hypothetical protein